MRRRYAPFLSRGAGFELLCAEGPPRQTPFRPETVWGGQTLRLERGDFKAFLDTRSGRGRLIAAANEQCLDAFLRSLISSLLLREGGLMLHSAGLVKGGKAWLFPGKSGAGKSTLAKLAAAAGAEVISDEINLVRVKAGRPVVYGSPFWGEMRSAGRQGSWPLGGIFLPEKSRENAVRAVAPAVVFRVLMRCAVTFSRSARDGAAAMAAAGRLSAAVPARRLGFSKKSPDFLCLVR